MATRTFRVYLINQTPIPLKRVQLAVDHGDWTAPWYAPDTVAPGQTVGWQTESSGDIPIVGSIGTGTQGSITLQLEDAGHFFSGPGQTDVGHEDQLYIFWDTPFLGLTTADVHWRVLSDIPAEGGSFATKGYRDGPSSAYQVKAWVHSEYDGPGSPCPYPAATGLTGPGPIDTTGWTEVVPGVFALPIPDPAIPHAQVDIYIQVKPGFVISDDANPAAPVFTSGASDPISVKPCANAPLGAFGGTWGDDVDEPSARILVVIEPERSTSSASRHVASAAASQISRRGGFTVSVTDNSMAPHVHLQTEHVDVSSVLVSHYTGDVRRPVDRRKLSSPRSPSASAAVASAHLANPARSQSVARLNQAVVSPPTPGSAAATGVARTSMEFVDTLALSQTVSLHLYSLQDDQTKQQIGYRVRYMKTATDGALIEDVMLGESRQPPA